MNQKQLELMVEFQKKLNKTNNVLEVLELVDEQCREQSK